MAHPYATGEYIVITFTFYAAWQTELSMERLCHERLLTDFWTEKIGCSDYAVKYSTPFLCPSFYISNHKYFFCVSGIIVDIGTIKLKMT